MRRDQNPSGGGKIAPALPVIAYRASLLIEVLGARRALRSQIQIPVGDVQRQDPVRLEMFEVQRQSLARQQVDRNRVARKRVDRENVVVLRASVLELLFQRKPGVAH